MANKYTADQLIKLKEENWPEIHDSIHEFVVYLNRVRDMGLARGIRILNEHNLSAGEFDILVTLRSTTAPPYVLTPTELQQAVLITSGGLTKLLYQLEARDLVSRSVQKQDKRSKLVHLTAKGKRLVEKVMTVVRNEQRAWIAETFTASELDQLNKLLGKAASALESGHG